MKLSFFHTDMRLPVAMLRDSFDHLFNQKKISDEEFICWIGLALCLWFL